MEETTGSTGKKWEKLISSEYVMVNKLTQSLRMKIRAEFALENQ